MLGTPVLEWSYADHLKYFGLGFRMPRICGFHTDYAGEFALVCMVLVLASCLALACCCCFRRKRAKSEGPPVEVGSVVKPLLPGE